ncbi:MAG: hypothetical protein NZ455_01475 [Bacteroidia bacterium]|nr:hypothetical protein [Bacteroidia bacterium]
MRRASRQAWCAASCPRFYSCPGGGAQHRQPVARRPCPHERSKTWARTRPKKHKIFLISFYLYSNSTLKYFCSSMIF